MTRGEAKKFLTNLSWSVGTTAMEYWGDETGRKIREAVKSLEQEPILDKIRAEINSPNRGTCDYFIVDRIEEIINEYTAESDKGADE